MAQWCLAELNERDHIRGIDNAVNAKSSRTGRTMVFAAMLQWAQSLRSKAADVPLRAGRHAIIAGFLYLIAYVVLDPVGIIGSKSSFAIPSWESTSGPGLRSNSVVRCAAVPIPVYRPLARGHCQSACTSALENRNTFGDRNRGVLFGLVLAFAGAENSLQPFLNVDERPRSADVCSGRRLECRGAGLHRFLIMAGALSADSFIMATVRYWLGDMIGILGVTPFALLLWDGRRTLLRLGVGGSVCCHRRRTGNCIWNLCGEGIPTLLHPLLAYSLDGGSRWNRSRRWRHPVSASRLGSWLATLLGGAPRYGCLSGDDSRSDNHRTGSSGRL